MSKTGASVFAVCAVLLLGSWPCSLAVAQDRSAWPPPAEQPAAEPAEPEPEPKAAAEPTSGDQPATASGSSAAEPPAPASSSSPAEPAAPATESGFDLGGPGFEMQPMAPRPSYDTDVPRESTPVRGWFRFDVDKRGPRFWVGAVHSLGGLDFATDVYFEGPYAVLDVGVVFSFLRGALSFLPMVGMGVNFAEGEAANIIGPQLFTIIDTDPVYFESWVQLYFNEVFDTYAGRLRGPGNQFYTRNFLLYNVSNHFAVGPQFEMAYDFSAGGWLSLPIGGGVNVYYGEQNTLALYLAYDTQASDDDRLAGRVTFIRTW